MTNQESAFPIVHTEMFQCLRMPVRLRCQSYET